MTEPIFWLALSLLLVAVCLTAVLVAAIPALQELGRAARSAEKLFDTLYRELPPTLEAIRLTGLEISDLTDDVSEGVESAGNVVKQVDQGLRTAQRQVQDAGVVTRSLFAGMKAAWKNLTRPAAKRRRGRTSDRISQPKSLARGYDEPQWPLTPVTPAKSAPSVIPNHLGDQASASIEKPETFPDQPSSLD